MEGGFRVSSSCRMIRYLVTQSNGHLVCTCPDFWRHEDEPGFRCKHCLIVVMAQAAGHLPETFDRPAVGDLPGSRMDADDPACLPIHSRQLVPRPRRLFVRQSHGWRKCDRIGAHRPGKVQVPLSLVFAIPFAGNLDVKDRLSHTPPIRAPITPDANPAPRQPGDHAGGQGERDGRRHDHGIPVAWYLKASD